QLVTKCEDLRLQGGTGPKTRGYQSEKGDEKRVHRGSHHDLTNDRNLCVFRSDGVFGNDNHAMIFRLGDAQKRYFVRDLGSSCGTYVNGERLQSEGDHDLRQSCRTVM